MLPLGDDNSARRIVPIVTYALIIINIIAYVIERSAPDPVQFLFEWGTIPSQIVAGNGLITLITSMFLHDPSSYLHIASNMLFLWIFGDNVEDAFGHTLYTIFYFVCGIAASLAQVLMDPSSNTPGVGASGAISGLLAAYIIMFGSNRIRVLIGFFVTTVPAYVMIGLWILLQFINGFGSVTGNANDNVAYFAHIGGFIAGLVLTVVMRVLARRPTVRPDVVRRSLPR